MTKRTKVLGGRCDGQSFDLPAGQTEVLGRDDRFGYRYLLGDDGALHYTGESWPIEDFDWRAFEAEFAQYTGAVPVAPKITIPVGEQAGR